MITRKFKFAQTLKSFLKQKRRLDHKLQGTNFKLLVLKGKILPLNLKRSVPFSGTQFKETQYKCQVPDF